MSMDDDTTIESLKRAVIAFRDERDWRPFHDVRNLAMGLSIESAELLEGFLWKSDEQIDLMLRGEEAREVRHELADVMVYLLYLSEATGIDLASAVREKIALNAVRYPIDKARGSNKKYTEL